MNRIHLVASLCPLVLSVACGEAAHPTPAGDAAPDVAPDAATVVPLIGDVLACGKKGSAGATEPGTELPKVTLDTKVFPNALCNDGSPAVLYVRPASDPGAKNKWLIHISGGGACGDGDACAERWCSADTNFGKEHMSSTTEPKGTIGVGISESRPENPFAGYNHVYVPYCSSDEWSGQARDVVVAGKNPAGGTPVSYRIHFLGAAILDAIVSTLRKDGASVPDVNGVPVPDLDDAELVVLAGASAGSAGVKHNLDRFAATLRAKNTACQGASCGLQVLGLLDSSYSPSLSGVDLSTSIPCTTKGLCSYEQLIKTVVIDGEAKLWKQRGDESCATWHAANDPAHAWECGDAIHVLRNHLTTPFMVRAGQTDELHLSNWLPMGFTVPNRGPMTKQLFAELVRTEMATLPNMSIDAEEAGVVSRNPAVYAPLCSKHDTLRSNPNVYEVLVQAQGKGRTMFDVWNAWMAGTTPSAAIAQPGDPVVCP